MSRHFALTMFPAREGDCLLLTYEGDGRLHRALIDGGRAATAHHVRAELAALPPEERALELLLVTHVDRDHIEGVLSLLEGDAGCPVTFADLWFNGYHHLRHQAEEQYGARQGERLSMWLQRNAHPWNEAFGRGPIEVSGPQVTLAGDLKVTVLSPDRLQLEKLLPVWEEECKNANLIPGATPRRPAPPGFEHMGRLDIAALAGSNFTPDSKEANGSTIALLVEHDDRRILLGGDAHVDRLISSLTPLAAAEGHRVRLDALKVPHHGSAGNLSNDLLALLDCDRYLISTNGDYFSHPHPEAIARIICNGGTEPELIFNYRTTQTTRWDIAAWQQNYGYRVNYPPAGQNGTVTITFRGTG